MADIKKSTNHCLEESELRPRLEKLADEMKEKFGIRCDFEGNVAHLSGGVLTSGAVTWTSDTLAIELSLGFMGKMFKTQIEKEIETRIVSIVAA